MSCPAVKLDGVVCGVHLKGGNQYCGRHRDITEHAQKTSLVNRYIFIINDLDKQQFIQRRQIASLYEMSIPQLQTVIAEAEGILRPCYPTYAGHFCKTHKADILSRYEPPQTAYTKYISGLPDATRMMVHVDYSKLRRYLVDIFEKYGADVPYFTVHDLFDPAFVENVIEPAFITLSQDLLYKERSAVYYRIQDVQEFPGGSPHLSTLHQICKIPALMLDAIARIPPNLKHQRDLMFEWLAKFRRHINAAFKANGIGLTLTLLDLCMPDLIVDIVQPRLEAIWAHVVHDEKREFHRCFLNLGILGRDEIRSLGLHLPPPPANVQDFAEDKQNIHRSETVKFVLDTYKLLCAIPVPADQRTIFEIQQKCNLTPAALQLLHQHYDTPVDIYELDKPYPKALDGVWAFVRSHAEKAELYVRVADELNDNVGMCAQGNLSRLCNILSGYLEGIKVAVPVGEILQEKMASIAADDAEDKVERAKGVLTELNIPADQWDNWLSAF